MTSRRDCKKYNDEMDKLNPNREGFAKNYFKPGCSDPATALSYWRRRFNSTDRYLANYWYPRTWGKTISKGYLQTKDFKVYDTPVHKTYSNDNNSISLTSSPSLNDTILGQNNGSKKIYLTSAGAGIRSFYGAYCFIKAFPNVLEKLEKIAAVSGSSWFFTSLYSNLEFYNNVINEPVDTFILDWNANYCGNIIDYTESNTGLSSPSDSGCGVVNEILKIIDSLTKFVNVPGAHWGDFVSDVILKYKDNLPNIVDLPELLYGITFPLSIFHKNNNDDNNGVLISNDTYNNNEYCIPVYYNYQEERFYSAVKDADTFNMYNTKITGCEFDITNDNTSFDTLKISELEPYDTKSLGINYISGACSAAGGVISSPGILAGILKDVHLGILCNDIEKCLPNPLINLGVKMKTKNNSICKLIDGAYTDDSGLAVTLSNIFKDGAPDINETINIISLNYGSLKKHNIFSDKIDGKSSDLYRFFNNSNGDIATINDQDIKAPDGGIMPNLVFFKEAFPDNIKDWEWSNHLIKFHNGTFTTIENKNFGILPGYKVNLMIVSFNWSTGMIDFGIKVDTLNEHLNDSYLHICGDTIDYLKSISSLVNLVYGS